MELKCLTYSSYATSGLQPIDLEAILRTCVRNNARDAITGVMMFNGAVFVQTLEGPPDAVDRTMGRIRQDERNCEVKVLDERMLERRIFPEWSMGYVRLDGGWLEGQHDVVEALGHDMPAPVYEILESLATTLPFG